MDGDSSGSQPSGDAGRVALFRFDPGWPFLIAGLALIVSAVLIPAQRELHDLEQRLAVHRAHEERSNAELLAYHQFLADIARGDERLLERLVRAQLNRMPKEERPLLLMPSANETVPHWIESSVTVEIPEVVPYPDTLLSRIATGPRRLWVLASGAFLVFLGVMFAPGGGSARRSAAVEGDGPGVGAPEAFGAGAATAVAVLDADDLDDAACDGEFAGESGADEQSLDESGETDAERGLWDDADDAAPSAHVPEIETETETETKAETEAEVSGAMSMALRPELSADALANVAAEFVDGSAAASAVERATEAVGGVAGLEIEPPACGGSELEDEAEL
ncbi:MAG: hypothetical protein RL136_2196, partial [Planctomycetota bacterium]